MPRTLILFVFLSFSSAILAQDFYKPGIQEIKIQFPEKEWHHHLDSLKRVNPEARTAGTVWLNGQKMDSVGVRYKGNSSFFRTSKQTLKKLPFNIKLDYKIKTQRLGEYNAIRLSNAFLDPSFIRDPLAYEVVRTYMPAPMCNFARLQINGEPYGLYVNTEGIDLAFLKKHFGYKGGYLVKCDPDQWQKVRSQTGCPKGENASLSYLSENAGCYSAFYEVDDPAAWSHLIRLIKTLNKKPADIESVLDVDQALWMLALNNAMVNLDSYNGSLSHNYYLWFDTSGVAHPLIWDLNMSFGGWRRNLSYEEMTDDQLIRFQPLAEMDNSRRPLIAQLFKNSYYRKIYLAHLRTINNEWFKSGKLFQRADALMKEIDAAVQQDKQKLYTYEDFKNSMDQTMENGADKIIGIRQLMGKRSEYLASHPLLTKEQPALSVPGHKKEAATVVLTVILKNALGGFAHYRADRMMAFKRVALHDDGTQGDAVAGDGIFSAVAPAAQAVQYYFSAENADAAATLPERASYEFFTVK